MHRELNTLSPNWVATSRRVIGKVLREGPLQQTSWPSRTRRTRSRLGSWHHAEKVAPTTWSSISTLSAGQRGAICMGLLDVILLLFVDVGRFGAPVASAATQTGGAEFRTHHVHDTVSERKCTTSHGGASMRRRRGPNAGRAGWPTGAQSTITWTPPVEDWRSAWITHTIVCLREAVEPFNRPQAFLKARGFKLGVCVLFKVIPGKPHVRVVGPQRRPLRGAVGTKVTMLLSQGNRGGRRFRSAVRSNVGTSHRRETSKSRRLSGLKT